MPLYNNHTDETAGTVADAEIINALAANALIRADGEVLLEGEMHGHARVQVTEWNGYLSLGLSRLVTFPGFQSMPMLWLYWRKISGTTNLQWTSRGWGTSDMLRARFQAYSRPFSQVGGVWRCEVYLQIPPSEAGTYEFRLIAVGA